MTRARDLADSADKDIAGTITLDAVNASGVITGLTVEATGDTAAGDNAAIGYTAAEGLILTGQGSTNDVTIKNDADADVIEIPTGTVNVTMAGTLGVTGVVTSNAGVVVDNFTLDGTTLALSSGDFTLDVAGRVILSADDNGEIRLQDGASIYGQFKDDDGRFKIQSMISNKAMLLVGNDNGAEVTALQLDMENAGAATFNSSVIIPQNLQHAGDSDTMLQFSAANTIRLVAGNVETFKTTASEITIGAGADLVTTTAAAATHFRAGPGAGDSVDANGGYGVTIGKDAGTALSSGAGAVAIGYEALETEDTRAEVVAVGFRALRNQNAGAASYNAAFGYGAGEQLTTAVRCTFIGTKSGHTGVVTGSSNTGIGFETLQDVAGGISNLAAGSEAGYTLAAGDYNAYLGSASGYSNNGSNNTFVGFASGYLSTGSRNTFVGARNGTHGCGQLMTDGDKNTILGGFDGNQGGVDIRAADNHIVLADGDGNPRLHINNAGQVSMGTSMSFGGSGYGTAGFTFNYNGADYTAAFRSLSSTNSALYGPIIDYVNASPNGAGNAFISCSDSGASRFRVRSDGGVANFQANDANLSDERVKKDISLLGSMWDKFKAIEIVNFKYKDQTHEDFNIGVIAQQVESVAAEFVDNSGWGETVEGEDPLKSIFTTDLYHAAIKALQEAMTRIETLETQNASFEARITALEGA